MEEKRQTHTLLYMHRNKMNTEVVGYWDSTKRAATLQGCCTTTVYRINPENHLHVYTGSIWTSRLPLDVPEEIKFAAMLVN